MNVNGEEYRIDPTSPLATTDPLLVALCLGAAILLAWLCARAFRRTNDFAKSVRLYLPLGAVALVVFCLLGLPLLFSAGCVLCGFVTMMWFSNYYFYH